MMDQKARNRLIISLIGVPVIIFCINLILTRSMIAVIIYVDRISSFMNPRVLFYLKNSILIGISLWVLLFAYVFVRYGEFKLSRLKIGRE